MKLGQIISSSIENDKTSMSLSRVKIGYSSYLNGTQEETGFKISGNNNTSTFEKGATYYIQFNNLQKKDGVKIILFNTDTGYEMPIRIIPSFSIGFYDFIFTPDRDGYNHILFVSLNSTPINSINVSLGQQYKIEKLTNIVENGNFKEIGIQGEPGLRFSINGGDFTLGKSGSFYLSDIEITQMGFHIREKIDNPPIGLPFNKDKEFFIVSFQQ